MLEIGTLVIFAPGVVARTRRVQQFDGFHVQSNVMNLGLAAIAAFGFLMCALGFPALKPSASYVASLVALLLTCAIVFFRVSASLLGPHAPE